MCRIGPQFVLLLFILTLRCGDLEIRWRPAPGQRGRSVTVVGFGLCADSAALFIAHAEPTRSSRGRKGESTRRRGSMPTAGADGGEKEMGEGGHDGELFENVATSERKIDVGADGDVAEGKLESDHEHRGNADSILADEEKKCIDIANSIGSEFIQGAGQETEKHEGLAAEGTLTNTKESAISGADAGGGTEPLDPATDHNTADDASRREPRDGERSEEVSAIASNEGTDLAKKKRETSPPHGSSEGAQGGDSASNIPSAPLAPEWPSYCDPTYRMPAELAVRVIVDNEVRTISIKIERFSGEKVFQGGYRHKATGRVFHHASSQFGQQERPVKETGHLRTRDTQTCQIKSRTMQTTNECGTQVKI